MGLSLGVQLLLILAAVLTSVIVGMLAGLLAHLDGARVPSSIGRSGAAFAVALTLLLLVLTSIRALD